MYSQLLGDEWSEAFEAFKDSTMAKEGDDDDDEEMYTNILSILQTLVKASSQYSKEKKVKVLIFFNFLLIQIVSRIVKKCFCELKLMFYVLDITLTYFVFAVSLSFFSVF